MCKVELRVDYGLWIVKSALITIEIRYSVPANSNVAGESSHEVLTIHKP